MSVVDISVGLKPNLPFPLLRSDRDRDVFDLENAVLIVASDRLSVSGCTLSEVIPDKGRILTGIANFWFGATRDILPNHLLATDAGDFPGELRAFRESLEGRAILARKIRPIPVGTTVRGYLAGSAYEEYLATGSVCGLRLPPKIKLAARLPEPIFTPYLCNENGCRQDITMAEMMTHLGTRLTRRIKERSLALYIRGYHLAWERGIILADARFEFGLLENEKLILADEVLTPGSSSYWAEDRWRPGTPPIALDRHQLMKYLETEAEWDGTPPAPHLPAAIVEAIRKSYQDLALRFGIAP